MNVIVKSAILPMRLVLTLALGLGILSGCALPRGAALQSEILAEPKQGAKDFAVYAVTKSLLPKVARWPHTGGTEASGWPGHQHQPGAVMIGVGDQVNLQVWDSEENSLLTAPGQKVVSLLNVAVSGDGTIFVPYLDKIKISGLSSDAARQLIQQEMSLIIPSAQVQMTVALGRRNGVDLVGGVATPGNYTLPDEHFTLLNLVSLGGGVAPSLRNPQVRLSRGGRIYASSLNRIYANPGLDTVLRGGDKVIVEQDKRYFLSLGASNSQSIVYFEKDKITALDAMSLVGGLLNTRADPKGILILRDYPSGAVRKDNSGPSNARTIFTLDLTTADGLFSAKKFAVNPGDVVLVTESPVTSTQTILGLLGSVATVANKF